MATLSVLMCNYNHSRFLPESIGAIVSQSRLPDEFIIVDDGSTDNSVEIIQEFAIRYPFVRLIQHERNRGVVQAVSKAIEAISGDYIYGAGADDRVLPGFFEKSMRMLENYPQAGLCCSYPTFFSDVTGQVTQNPTGWCTRPQYFSPDEIAAIPGIEAIPAWTSVIKRSAFLGAGAYLPELKWQSDWFNSFVVAFRQGMCHIPESLAHYRVVSTSYAAAGNRDPIAKQQVCEHLTRLLESKEYQDIASYFYSSGVLLHVNPLYFLPFHHERGIQVPAHRYARHLPLDVLERNLSDPDPEIRELAAFWLRQFRDDRAKLIPLLKGSLSDPDAYVRLAAANSLYTLVSQEHEMGWLAAALTRPTFRLEHQISAAQKRGASNRPSPDWLFRRLAAVAAAALGGRIRSVEQKT